MKKNLVSKFRRQRSSNGFVGVAARGRLYEGIKFLEKHFCQPITVHDIVEAAAMSRRGLYKAFQRQTGQSPGRELRRLRIERAESLLDHSSLELKVIARKCGYRSVNSFWVAFREVTGVSPGKYRLRHFEVTKSRPAFGLTAEKSNGRANRRSR